MVEQMRKMTLIADTKHPKTKAIVVRGSFDNSNKSLRELWEKRHKKRKIRNRIAMESRRRNKYSQKGN